MSEEETKTSLGLDDNTEHSSYTFLLTLVVNPDLN